MLSIGQKLLRHYFWSQVRLPDMVYNIHWLRIAFVNTLKMPVFICKILYDSGPSWLTCFMFNKYVRIIHCIYNKIIVNDCLFPHFSSRLDVEQSAMKIISQSSFNLYLVQNTASHLTILFIGLPLWLLLFLILKLLSTKILYYYVLCRDSYFQNKK